jgi:phospholipid/cholesterol/gamma-HCH transport system substrate-binding protein
METRAHHLLIGIFVVFLFGWALVFAVWSAKMDIDEEFVYYDIHFAESVAGLTKASDVQYNGIPIGNVDQIAYMPESPELVKVSVKIGSEIPIKTTSTAVLSINPLTGTAFVLIEGGKEFGEDLAKVKKDGDYPLIKSRVSPLQKFFQDAPTLLAKAATLLDNIEKFISDENAAKVADTIANVAEISENIKEESKQLKVVFDNVKTVVKELKTTVTSMNTFIASAEGVVSNDLKVSMGRINDTLESAEKFIDEMTGVIDENKGAITAFTSNALPEMSRLILDIRRMSQALAGLAEKIEQAPSEAIFPRTKPEYKTGNN